MLKLNLGSCETKIPGFLSVDLYPPAEVIADLREPWPWEDSSVDEVMARSVFEHLPDKIHTMNELWRVLRPNGSACVTLPVASQGDGGFCDPTHCSYWTPSDFEYVTAGDPHRERFDGHYRVKSRFRVGGLDTRGHIPTKRYERRYGGYVVEMTVVLEAVK